MAISKKRKQELVAQYTKELQASQGMILADYRGLGVADMERLRHSLREEKAALRVVKNRLLKLALSQTGIDLPQEWLLGPVAVAFCHDEVPPVAKVLSDFAKEAEALSVKGGWLDQNVLSQAEVKTLASLPPRDVLLAQVVGTINGPASQTAGVIASSVRQILNVLQAYVDKLEGNNPAPQAA